MLCEGRECDETALCEGEGDLVRQSCATQQCTEAAQGPLTSVIIRIVRDLRVDDMCRLHTNMCH
jgi:hypothetical protein